MDEKVGSKVGNEEEASKDEQEEVASLGNKGSRGGEERQLHLHHHGEKEGGALANSNQDRWAQSGRLRCGNSAVLALGNVKRNGSRNCDCRECDAKENADHQDERGYIGDERQVLRPVVPAEAFFIEAVQQRLAGEQQGHKVEADHHYSAVTSGIEALHPTSGFDQEEPLNHNRGEAVGAHVLAEERHEVVRGAEEVRCVLQIAGIA